MSLTQIEYLLLEIAKRRAWLMRMHNITQIEQGGHIIVNDPKINQLYNDAEKIIKLLRMNTMISPTPGWNHIPKHITVIHTSSGCE